MAGLIAISIYAITLTFACVYLAFRLALAEAKVAYYGPAKTTSLEQPAESHNLSTVAALTCTSKEGSICDLHRQPLKDGSCQISGIQLASATPANKKTFPSPRTFVTGSQFVQNLERESMKDFKEA